jgi:acyl transferase domain-containing protein
VSHLVFLFSGQGSQAFHMGQEIAEKCPPLGARLREFDHIAHAALGHSVLDIVSDPARNRFDPFDRLLHSNAALFMLQFSLAEFLMQAGARPVALLGASLGELVALTLAGAWTPEQGLRLVIDMSQALERGLPPGGGMLVVLTPPSIMSDRPDLFPQVELAGISSKQHFIAAGPVERLKRIEHALGQEGVPCMILPVRYAFHSSHIDTTSAALAAVFARQTAPLTLPVISCVTGDAIRTVPAGHLWRVVREPMRIADAFAGLEARQDSIFVDLGPSGTMATVAKYNLRSGSKSELLSVMSPFTNEWSGFENVRKRLGV